MKRLPLFLAFSLMTMPAAAQAGFTAAQREACKADYEKFCKDVAPGGGRIVKCLRDRSAELGHQCRAVVAEVAAHRTAREACEADYHRFCGSVTPGGGAVMKCLRERESQLEAGCRNALGTTGKVRE
jgi:hypothetical protein